jgi:predicted MPP superfamily phosphohydrolase
MRLRPDLILLPGDLFQGDAATFERELPRLRALVARLHAPGGVFFVEGDADDLRRIARVVRGSEVRVLEDEVVRARVRGRWVTVAGLRLTWGSPGARRAIRRLSDRRGAGDVRLLVAHRPDAALSPVASRRIDLVVAGHTHGGQLQLPVLGPPVIASDVPRAVGAGGLHHLPGAPRLYVSRGVGVERGQAPRMRVLAPPEVSLIELGERGRRQVRR